MSPKVAILISVFGLILAIASIVYGYSAPATIEPEKTTERIRSATTRHAHVVEIEKAARGDNEKAMAKAREKFSEAKRKNNELIAARNKAIKRHARITGALRYSGCICMLVAPLMFLAKSESS